MADNLMVYTTGGGYFVQDILQFLAMYTSSNDYVTLLNIGVVAGILCLSFSMLMGLPAKALLQTFVVMFLAGGLFIGRTADVDIHDKTLGNLSYYQTVENVPYGVALLAHYTTGVSYHVTKKLEQLLSTPNDLAYQSNGITFGATIIAQQARWRAVDGIIHERMVDFYQNCMVRGANLGYFPVDAIARAPDLAAATAANLPQALSYYDVGTTSVETCVEGWATLTTDVTAEVDNVLAAQAASVYNTRPGADGAATVTKMTNTLSAMQGYVGMSSASATHTVKQALLINAMDDSVSRYAALSGNTAALFNLANAVADGQRRSAYASVGVAATKWVPYLKIVFEVLYYGVFPFAAMLMFTPMAWSVFKGYFGGFLWLASWEPLSAILHSIVLGAASGFYREAAVQTSDGLPSDVAMTWSNHFGIIAAEQEIGVTAGYLMMSVPFVSTAIFFGARSMTSLATSMLAVGQSTATEAGRMAATGNVTLSTAGMNTMRANTWETSARVDTGRASTYLKDGSSLTYNADGSRNYGGGSAIPQGVGLSMAMDQGIRSEVSSRASSSRAAARTAVSELSNYVNEGASKFSSVVDNASTAINAGLSNTQGFSASQTRSLSRAKDTIDRASQEAGISSNLLMKAGIATKMGVPEKAFIDANGGLDASSRANAQRAWQAATSSQVQTAMAEIDSIGRSANWGDSASAGTNTNEGDRWSLDQGRRMTASTASSLREANEFTEAEGNIRSSGVGSTRQLTAIAQTKLNEMHPNDPARVASILNARDFGALKDQEQVMDAVLDEVLKSYGFDAPIADGTQGFDAGANYQPGSEQTPPNNIDAARAPIVDRHDGMASDHRQREGHMRDNHGLSERAFDTRYGDIRSEVEASADQSLPSELGERGVAAAVSVPGVVASGANRLSNAFGAAKSWLFGEDPAPLQAPDRKLSSSAPIPMTLRDRDAAIRTVLGEAGAETQEGQAAVASVLRNRVEDVRYPSSVGSVALQDRQFSSWNREADGTRPNDRFSPNTDAYRQAGEIVDAVFAGTYQDRTRGAVNFYAPDLMAQDYHAGKVSGPVPKWYDEVTAERSTPPIDIGGHRFTGEKR